MQDHYTINVSKRREKPGWNGEPAYSHFFATAENSCVTAKEALEVYAALKLVFPAPEYQIAVTHWEARGREVDFEK